MAIVNKQADEDDDIMRISIDAKNTVKIGNLSRGGQSRVNHKADDHDFDVTGQLTPVGIYQPQTKELALYMSRDRPTSDCYVDVIEDWWGAQPNKNNVRRVVINLDNGPEQHSHRTQFMKRIQDFSNQEKLEIHLAYYPPYHSKYNPIERTFGALEQYWSGEILNSEEAVLGFAKNMKWSGKHPIVKLVEKSYATGITVVKKIMNDLNLGFFRKEGIEKWSVLIFPKTRSG